MTPYEKLKSLSQAESYLRPGVTLEGLETIANQMSDNQFAERMVNARSNLFQQITRFVDCRQLCLVSLCAGLWLVDSEGLGLCEICF